MAAQSGRGASPAISHGPGRSRFPVAGLPLECNSSGAEPPLLAGGIRGCPVSWNFRASAQPFTGYRPGPRKGASGPQMPTLSSCRTSLRKRPLPGRRGGFEGYHARRFFLASAADPPRLPASPAEGEAPRRCGRLSTAHSGWLFPQAIPRFPLPQAAPHREALPVLTEPGRPPKLPAAR